MKFNIEEYLVTEETEANDIQEEYKDNIEVLKKAGLDSIVSKAEDSSTTIPFLLVKGAREKIVKQVFDTTWSLSSFDRNIPLRVASLLALCKDKQYFKDITIRGDFNTSNPMFCSYIATGVDEEGDLYLISRWSLHPLESFKTLRDRAIPKIKKKIQLKIQEQIKDAERDLGNLESIVEDYISGKWIKYYI